MNTSADNTTVRIERRAGVVRLVLDRPAEGNALNLQMAQEALAGLRAAEADPEIHLLSVTGEGRFFCAGGDVKSMAERRPPERAEFLRALANAAHELALAIARSRLVVIAGVNGAAAGAGFGLMLTADWVLISDNATLVSAYAKIGLTPDTGVSYILPRIVGHSRAVDLTLAGRQLTAIEAVEWGLANQSVPAADFSERLTQIENKFLESPIHILDPTKRLLRAGGIEGFEAHLRAEATNIARISEHPGSVDLVERFVNR